MNGSAKWEAWEGEWESDQMIGIWVCACVHVFMPENKLNLPFPIVKWHNTYNGEFDANLAAAADFIYFPEIYRIHGESRCRHWWMLLFGWFCCTQFIYVGLSVFKSSHQHIVTRDKRLCHRLFQGAESEGKSTVRKQNEHELHQHFSCSNSMLKWKFYLYWNWFAM